MLCLAQRPPCGGDDKQRQWGGACCGVCNQEPGSHAQHQSGQVSGSVTKKPSILLRSSLLPTTGDRMDESWVDPGPPPNYVIVC